MMLTPLICQIVWRSSMSYSNMKVTTLCVLATSTIYFIRVLCTPQYKFTLALSLVRFQFAPKVVQRFVLCGLNGCLFEAIYDVFSNVYLPNFVTDTSKRFRVVERSNYVTRKKHTSFSTSYDKLIYKIHAIRLENYIFTMHHLNTTVKHYCS